MTGRNSLYLRRREFLKLTAAGSLLATPFVSSSSFAQAAKAKVLLTSAPPDPAAHFYYYALENGFFKEEGIDVEIQPIAVETTVVRALAAGEGDFADPGAASTLKAMAGGAKLRVIANFKGKPDYLIVGKKDIADINALEGRSLAVSQVGASTYNYSVFMLENSKADPKKVQWVAPGSSGARYTTLMAGRVDAAIISSAFMADALKDPRFHVIADARAALPTYPWTYDVASVNVVSNRPEVVQSFVNGLARSLRWMRKNPNDAIKISQKILPDMSAEALTTSITRFVQKGTYNETGFIQEEAFDRSVKDMVSHEQLDKPVKLAEVFEPRFTKATFDKLGPPPD